MVTDQLRLLSKKAGLCFYIGDDTEGWSTIVTLTKEIESLVVDKKLGDDCLKRLLREISFIEEQKPVGNYPLIADSLYHQIPEILDSDDKRS